MAKTISQREARALRQRVDELEGILSRQANAWACDYPGGVNIATLTWQGEESTCIRVNTARRLGHAVVAVATDDRQLRFYAIRQQAK